MKDKKPTHTSYYCGFINRAIFLLGYVILAQKQPLLRVVVQYMAAALVRKKNSFRTVGILKEKK